MTDGTASAQPGWYPDPTQPGQLRYWSGTEWTHDVQPATPPAPREVEQEWPWRPGFLVRTGDGWYLLARLVLVGLGALTLTYVLDIGGSWWAMHALARWVNNPATYSLAQAQRVDLINQGSALIESLLLLATGVLFLCWLFQAQRRPLPSPSALTLRRGWAIGGWFVPFANFVLPYRVIANLDRATSRPPRRADPVIGWWWGAYIVFVIMGLALGSAAGNSGVPRSQTLQHLHSVEMMDIWHSAFAVVAAVLAMLMVHRITGRVRTPSVMEPSEVWEKPA